MSNIFGLRSRRFTRFIDLVRLLSLPAEEELTLLRVPILAHGEDGWRSFWFFRFLMSLTPAISRTRSTNAQRGALHRVLFNGYVRRGGILSPALPLKDQPHASYEYERGPEGRYGISGPPAPKLMPALIVTG